MGESSSDIQREITQLRGEVELVLDELETRTREAVDIKAQVRRHPRTIGLAAVLVLGMAGLMALATIGGLFRHSARPRRRSSGIFGLFFWPIVLTSLVPALVLVVRTKDRLPQNFDEIRQLLQNPGHLADFLRNLQ